MPSFWGSALRGGLGKWLRKTSCVLRSRQCDGCGIRASCAYGFMFETERTSAAHSGRINARPHPIVLEPPVPAPHKTEEGDEFSFVLILLDGANEFLPHLLYSMVKLGQEDGIGARARQGHGRFSIRAITCQDEVIFSQDGQELKKSNVLKSLELKNNTGNSPGRIEVEFETPFRVKYKGRFSREIPFHLLVRSALRRISSLEEAYGAGEPDLDYPGLVAKSEAIETVKEELSWKEVPRFSSRQKRKMMIGGPVGKVRYQGELGQFLPLLRYCETVHLGKQTFFGLGKIKVETC